MGLRSSSLPKLGIFILGVGIAILLEKLVRQISASLDPGLRPWPEIRCHVAAILDIYLSHPTSYLGCCDGCRGHLRVGDPRRLVHGGDGPGARCQACRVSRGGTRRGTLLPLLHLLGRGCHPCACGGSPGAAARARARALVPRGCSQLGQGHLGAGVGVLLRAPFGLLLLLPAGAGRGGDGLGGLDRHDGLPHHGAVEGHHHLEQALQLLGAAVGCHALPFAQQCP